MTVDEFNRNVNEKLQAQPKFERIKKEYRLALGGGMCCIDTWTTTYPFTVPTKQVLAELTNRFAEHYKVDPREICVNLSCEKDGYFVAMVEYQ